MPKVTRAVADENHNKIEASAARLFAEQGFADVTVANVMEAAGMTHGGFYRHYNSKVDLAAAACRYSFTNNAGGFFRKVANRPSGESGRDALLRMFLTTHHRDTPATGCPVAAYGPDMARERGPSPFKDEYIHGVKYVLAEITALIPGETLAQREQKAMGMLSALVGALCISRALKGDALSEQILDAASEFVKAIDQ